MTEKIKPKKEEPKIVKKEESEEDKKNVTEIVRVIEDKSIQTQDAFGKLNRAQIDLIKKTIAKGASDDELNMFIQVCKGANLNPFLKQAFLVPRWDSKDGKEVRAIQISIDGFRAIAEESGNYAGNDDPAFGKMMKFEIKDKQGKVTETKEVPESAMVTVYKIVQGVRCPFTATARWTEYYPGDRIGFMWKTKPHIMLGKCAEALALRKAFPKLLSGFYAQEEMEMTQVKDVKDEKTKKGIELITEIISKYTTVEQCDEYIEKITKSDKDKYTDEQKATLLKIANDKKGTLIDAIK